MTEKIPLPAIIAGRGTASYSENTISCAVNCAKISCTVKRKSGFSQNLVLVVPNGPPRSGSRIRHIVSRAGIRVRPDASLRKNLGSHQAFSVFGKSDVAPEHHFPEYQAAGCSEGYSYPEPKTWSGNIRYQSKLD